MGEYFPNTALVGTPSFTRKDVRVDFDWGAAVSPGGSSAPGFRDVGADHYSVRWTGQVVPRFGETYTFETTSDDGVRLSIKAAGSSTWNLLIDQWTEHAVAVDTAAYTMTAGAAYDLKLEYYEGAGDARIGLRWSGPSTPAEVIDPLADVGTSLSDWTAGYTDILRGAARNSWEGFGGRTAPAMDAAGWPMEDGSYVFQESLNQGLGLDPLMTGRINFRFTGKADVAIWGNVDTSSLTYNYDAAGNTTIGSFNAVDRGSNASYFHFINARRDGTPTGPGGITDLKLMRPTSPGTSASYSTDTTFTPQLIDALGHFTVIRHQLVANQEVEWSDRTLPTFFNQAAGSRTAPRYGNGDFSNNGPSWEEKVMLSNQAGRDMMISLPTVAGGRTPQDNGSYLWKLANLLRYGSDGVEPYTSPRADALYPPLNPNLRVYFELGNELWNWDGVFHTDWANVNAMTAADADAADADFRAINYDGLPMTRDANGAYTSMPTWRFRKIMLRTMQASDIFRSVFGDDAMMSRIRPLYEWQYANANDTARLALTFADRYFNNGDGLTHVADPRPVNHWIWGGGDATYYGAANPDGLTGLVSDPGFGAAAVPSGYTATPPGTTWTFAGPAGVARDGGVGDDIPPAVDGSQMGYITDKGSISFTFTVPAGQASDVYAVAFKAVNRTKAGASAADRQNLRVYLDGDIDITAKTFSQGNGYTPPGYNPAAPWMARNVFWAWSRHYATLTFSATAGSTHTITIRGMGDIADPANANQTAFLEGVQVTSVDRIFGDGMPGGGEAAGQPAGQNYRDMLNAEADWAGAYGLRFVSYEGGWSLGGDDGGSPLQLHAKYADARAAEVQSRSLAMFQRAGGAVSILGTYAQWPSWADFSARQGLLDVSPYPIIRGIDDRLNELAAEPTNGVFLPAILKSDTIVLGDGAGTDTGRIGTPGGWVAWNVLVPESATYMFVLTTVGPGGNAVMLVDDAPVASGATGGDLGGTVSLTAGRHTIKVRSTTPTAFTVAGITIAAQGAPPAPTLSDPVVGDGSAALTWSAVAGAAGYRVRYGSTPGVYPNAVDVGAATVYTVRGLYDGRPYYLAVDAYNAAGEGLPSNEKGAIPLASGRQGGLAMWDFTGLIGSEAAALAAATSNVAVGSITRGSGLVPSTSGWAAGMRHNRFASEPSEAARATYGSDLPGAIANGQYYQFVLTPPPSGTISLEGLAFRAFFQNRAGGAGLTYSTDGSTFSAGIPALGSPSTPGTPWTVDLAGRGDLHNVGSTVTIRIYLFGLGAYEVSALGDGSGDDLVVTGSYTLASIDAAPTVVSLAAASETVTDKSVALAAIGADDGGEPTLTYTWSVIGTPPAPVTFDSSGTNVAKNATATFSRAGLYQLLVTITDAGGQSVSSGLSVLVKQTLTQIDVAPGLPTLAAGTSLQFTATGHDQFGVALSTPPVFNWSVIGGGVVNGTGMFTAPGSSGTTIVQATSFGTVGVASVIVVAAPAAPSNLWYDAKRATLIWTDGASNESGFYVEWSLDKAAWTRLATVGSNAGTGGIASYKPARTSGRRFFRIRAYNGVGVSEASNSISVMMR